MNEEYFYYEEYKACLLSTICKGTKTYAGMLDRNGAQIAKECYEIAGRQDEAAAIVEVLPDDTFLSYADRLRPKWDVLDFTDSFVLSDFDWIVFAWSEDGEQGINEHPIFSNLGNVTTGFLIEASGDFPVAWLSHDPSVLSGIYPLSECLQKRYFSENKIGRIAAVFRLKGVS